MESFLVHLLKLVNFFNMPTFSSPPFCFLSHLSLLDERYQTIIQHRITKGNQDCFVRLCGCLFPLWSLPLFNSHQQPPNAPTLTHIHAISSPLDCPMHNWRNGTVLSWRSGSVSSVANMSTHTGHTHPMIKQKNMSMGGVCIMGEQEQGCRTKQVQFLF